MHRTAIVMDNSAKHLFTVDEDAIKRGHFFQRDAGCPYYTVACVLSGSVSIRHAAGQYEQQAFTLSLIPPNTIYSLNAPHAHREIYACFSALPEWQPWLDWGQGTGKNCVPVFLPLTDSESREKIIRGLRDALDYSHSPLPTGPRLAQLALEQVLVLASTLATHGGALDERLMRVLRAMREAMAQPWREQDMAQIATLSPSRFAHLFREKIGTPPLKYLEQLRMERARTLLLTTMVPVKEIAAGVGYPDALHFSSRFTHVFGHSPRQFRHVGSPKLPASGTIKG